MKTNIIRALTAVLFLSCFIGLGSCNKDDTSDDPSLLGERDLPYTYMNWMATLPDSLTLAQITLPGTHDCAADEHTGGVPSGSHWDVVCQDFSFPNQLKLGVRWFDVRYDDIDNRLHHYDYVLSRSLDDIIRDARDFLADHPSEVVVFLIKKEYGGSTDGTFSNKVASVLNGYSDDLFYMENNLPTLGEVRGKIVICTHDNSNHNGHALGPNYTWPGNTSLHFGNTDHFSFFVQDHYSLNYVDYDIKGNEIRTLIDISVEHPDRHRIDLNYTSGEKNARATTIETVAHNLNGNVRNYLLTHSGWRRCGVIMLNYAGGSDDGRCYSDLVRLIIQHNDFPEIKIGTQTWMGANLHIVNYRNGDPIPKVTDPDQWKTLTTGAYCIYGNIHTGYGYLYNWHAVNDPRGLAPTGYHVPSETEWNTLINYCGGTYAAGMVLKDVGTQHWWGDHGTNNYFFTAYPGGRRDTDGAYYALGESGFWWCSTASDATNAIAYWMNYDNHDVFQKTKEKIIGYTVRCIKD